MNQETIQKSLIKWRLCCLSALIGLRCKKNQMQPNYFHNLEFIILLSKSINKTQTKMYNDLLSIKTSDALINDFDQMRNI